MATPGDDLINFSGSLQTVTTTLTHSDSGYTLSIDDDYNVNTSIYDGLAGNDILFMTNVGDALFIENSLGQQAIMNVETIIAGNGGDLIILDHETFVLGDMLISGGAGDDVLWANVGNDTVSGADGNDIIDGGAGNDVLNGDAGDDEVYGGAGDDTIVDGLGADIYDGGDGADTYVFGSNLVVNGQVDTLSDAADGSVDTISFTGASSTFYTLSDLAFEINGNDLSIHATNSDTGDVRTIVIEGQFDSATSGIDTLVFNDNSTFDLRTVQPNVDPDAQDDAFSGDEDTDITGNVLANDSDANGDTLNAVAEVIVTEAGGTVEILANGDFTYTPAADFNGPDSFTYTVTDGNGGTSFANVDLTVNAVNDGPVAGDDAFSGDEDTDITGNVLGNDTDVDGDTLNVVAETITTAMGGTVELLVNGDFTYTPAADFNGADSFSYSVTDGNGGTSSANVDLTVNAVNDGPVAGDDAFSGDEDTDITGNVLGNDTDVDGDTLNVVAETITTAMGGTVELLANGDFTYTPAADFFGTDSFTYTVTDGNGGTDTADVTLDVADVPDVPVDVDVFGTEGQADVLQGGAGNDTLHYNVDGRWSGRFAARNVGSVNDDGTGQYKRIGGYNRTYDQFEGGAGIDTLIMTDGRDALFIHDIYSPRPDGTSGERVGDIEIIDAGAGNDVVDLTSDQYDYIDVTIYGGAGNDVLWASAGDDVVDGGTGNDDIYGGLGNDTLNGGEGRDVVRGAGGDDVIDGGADHDRLYGGDGNDTLFGGAGNDRLYGDDGNDTLNGGEGHDRLYGDDGDDMLFGDAGNDRLYGGDGNDTLSGGEGNDRLYGGDGSDTFVFDQLDRTDTVWDFSTAEQDMLDISSILSGYDSNVHNLEDFVQIVVRGNTTKLRVNEDGQGNDFTTVAVLRGEKLTDSVDDLVADGTLIV